MIEVLAEITHKRILSVVFPVTETIANRDRMLPVQFPVDSSSTPLKLGDQLLAEIKIQISSTTLQLEVRL